MTALTKPIIIESTQGQTEGLQRFGVKITITKKVT